MELLRSVLGGGTTPDSSSTIASAADTIERLVDRLCNATLLDDRRDACRALKAMSRKFRLEVGVQALEPVIAVLETDRGDEEILGYALDTVANVCSQDEFEEELAAAKSTTDPGGGSLGEQFSEIFLKHGTRNVQLVIDLLEEFTFRVRRPAVKCLTNLLMNRPRQMQEQILLSQMGVSRLMDVLVDSREVLRNDALLLLIQLTKGNANLQKIVAFENCFDKLVDIVQNEGHSDGGIVVEDCLRLMLNLLRNNPSNQTFFREGSYIQRVVPFFELNLDDDEMEIGWSAQKVSNTLHMLQVIRTLVAPSNPTHITSSCQSTILTCSLLEKLCSILMSAGIPADILTETINTISESIRGCAPNQAFFSRVQAPSIPPRPALILLLMSMVNEKQPFALRCAVLYCFQCFLHKNPSGQQEVMRTLLPSLAPAEAPPAAPEQPASATGGAAALDVTTGQLLCGGLFAGDRLSNWFSCVALAHGLMDQKDLKRELLRVQLSTVNDNEPVSLLLQCVSILQQTSNIQTRVGLLILLSTWSTDCTDGVSSLLSISSLVPFLTGQIGSNEHDESERLGQGLCAFLLGLCIVGNDNSVAGSTQENLFQLVEKRIGAEVFIDKLGEVSKHESYNKALKQPQIKCQEARDLFFDHKFCQQFKHLEHIVLNHMNKRKEKTAASAAEETSQNDPAVVAQYKDLIREQDTRIQELTFANIYLQQELASTKQQLEELSGTAQTLRDENMVLRAQHHNKPPPHLNGPVAAAAKPPDPPKQLPDGERALLERDLRAKDAVIHELEERLVAAASAGVSVSAVGPSQVEMDMLNSQMQALHSALSAKDAELEQARQQSGSGHAQEVTSLREELAALRADQEALLVMLSDQDSRMSGYRSRLKDLGQSVEEEDE